MKIGNKIMVLILIIGAAYTSHLGKPEDAYILSLVAIAILLSINMEKE